MMYNKKSSVGDIFTILVVLFVIGVGMFFYHFISNTVYDSFLKVDTINNTPEAKASFESAKTLTNKYDLISFACLIGLLLGTIILSYFIAGNPIFIGLYFLVIIVGVVVSPILSNVWETIVTNPTFGVTINALPLTNNILLNLPYYIALVGFISLIVLMFKPNDQF